MFVRRVSAVLLGLAGLFSSMMLLMSFADVSYSIAKGHEIDRKFRHAVAVIDRFKQSNARLPNDAEIDKLLNTPFDAYFLQLKPQGYMYCDSDLPAFTRPASGEYVLVIWRGEWDECFAPSTNDSTVALDEGDFSVIGSRVLDKLVLPIVALICFWGAKLLWRVGPLRI